MKLKRRFRHRQAVRRRQQQDAGGGFAQAAQDFCQQPVEQVVAPTRHVRHEFFQRAALLQSGEQAQRFGMAARKAIDRAQQFRRVVGIAEFAHQGDGVGFRQIVERPGRVNSGAGAVEARLNPAGENDFALIAARRQPLEQVPQFRVLNAMRFVQ